MNHTFIPLVHCGPVQPATQLQLFGAEHVPPFLQVLLQIAVIVLMDITWLIITHVKVSILHAICT